MQIELDTLEDEARKYKIKEINAKLFNSFYPLEAFDVKQRQINNLLHPTKALASETPLSIVDEI